jgi:glutathione-regulated potassium-efflux system ancillary protein KefG
MKEWLDAVLEYGWAYGQNASALHGKSLQCAVTIGASERAYQADGRNKYTIDEFLRPFEQTALLCGMDYVPPFVFYHSLKAEPGTIEAHAQAYKDLLTQHVGEHNE